MKNKKSIHNSYLYLLKIIGQIKIEILMIQGFSNISFTEI